VVVNTSAVHGSIGYSTNLFPAMTLGCGSPGGNITSDNIGPQHLMNVKRVAWESRAVEHRTIPADQRMAGATFSASPAEPAKAVAAAAASAVVAAVAAAGAGSASAVVPDRATIARIVERVFLTRGIPRGGAAKVEATNAPDAPAVPASNPAKPESSSASAGGETPAAPIAVPAKPASPPPPPIEVVDFVSENDVRIAMQRSEKIFVGPKTIVTPSARDLADSHDVFVRTELSPTAPPKSRGDSE
jgi:hypothetical protein